jgi:glutathione peroxidase-family protein
VQKFLLDKNGVPVSRWTSDADPVIMSDAIKAVLAA